MLSIKFNSSWFKIGKDPFHHLYLTGVCVCLCRKENEALVYNLQMEVKQLKADLQASQLQEEESVSQKGQLASLEKNHRYDLQRLKAQNDTLTNK